MNLPDVLRRNDRTLELVSGAAEPVDHKGPGGRWRAIRLAAGTRLRLRRADEFTAFKEFPRDPQWRLMRERDGGTVGLRVWLTRPDAAPSGAPLGAAELKPGEVERALAFDWPVEAAAGPFDLVLEQTGAPAAILSVGPLIDPRGKMRPLLRGKGVEVGPGLSPWVRPSHGVDVEYVEEKPPHEWQDVYGKGKASMQGLTPEVLVRYRVGNAVTLA